MGLAEFCLAYRKGILAKYPQLEAELKLGWEREDLRIAAEEARRAIWPRSQTRVTSTLPEFSGKSGALISASEGGDAYTVTRRIGEIEITITGPDLDKIIAALP